MPRVKRGVTARARHKKVLDLAKGFRGGRSKLFRQATEAVDRAMVQSYRHRKFKKRDYRGLWIIRVSAAAKLNGLTYSRLMEGLRKAKIALNRKMLSEIASHDPEGLTSVVQLAKAQLGK